MTVLMWDPKRAALIQVGLLLMAGHVVRLTRNGATYTVAGGHCSPTTFAPRES